MLHKSNQFARYIVNGLVATLIHFIVLTVTIKVIGVSSAGLSNLVSSIFGISASYIGNRLFVFTSSKDNIPRQALKFTIAFTIVALIHGFVLFLWTDLFGFRYETGFMIAVSIQIVLGYFFNSKIVFVK